MALPPQIAVPQVMRNAALGWTVSTRPSKVPSRMAEMMLMAVYLHLGPYSRFIISAMDRRIAEIDARESAPLVAAE